MTPEEQAETIRRYDARWERSGASMQTLGWRDRAQQALRFAILAEIDDLNGKSVLDVGCGFGDFYDYLLARGQHVQYVGMDINPTLLAAARERHPEVRFEERDILASPLEERFDYVVESGVFNHRLKDNERFAKTMLAEMYRVSRHGVAANLMSHHVDYREDHLYYYSPEEYARYGKTLSRFVTVRHDYPLYEFTIYVYRAPRVRMPEKGTKR